jgi:hypothetical protein
MPIPRTFEPTVFRTAGFLCWWPCRGMNGAGLVESQFKPVMTRYRAGPPGLALAQLKKRR